jgi:hypothetical protein
MRPILPNETHAHACYAGDLHGRFDQHGGWSFVEMEATRCQFWTRA